MNRALKCNMATNLFSPLKSECFYIRSQPFFAPCSPFFFLDVIRLRKSKSGCKRRQREHEGFGAQFPACKKIFFIKMILQMFLSIFSYLDFRVILLVLMSALCRKVGAKTNVELSSNLILHMWIFAVFYFLQFCINAHVSL